MVLIVEMEVETRFGCEICKHLKYPRGQRVCVDRNRDASQRALFVVKTQLAQGIPRESIYLTGQSQYLAPRVSDLNRLGALQQNPAHRTFECFDPLTDCRWRDVQFPSSRVECSLVYRGVERFQLLNVQHDLKLLLCGLRIISWTADYSTARLVTCSAIVTRRPPSSVLVSDSR